jgi:hypothetical protein
MFLSHPHIVDRARNQRFRRLSDREMEMKAIADKGKIKIGGGAINLIKTKPPTVTDNGKIKIGGGAIQLVKPVKK